MRFSPSTAICLLTVALAPVRLGAQFRSFDHGAFDTMLRAHVSKGLVDYDAFAASPEFARYLGQLSAFDPSGLGRDDQLAFWINAYNAYTIQLVNSHHERESIRNIDKSFGFVKGNGPWKERMAVVGGHSHGLDEIEQDIIRKRFGEPRIHFALVCAALGCPPLRAEAYTGARLEEQLEDQGRIFVARSPTKNRVDVGTRTVHLSPILVEFRDYIRDFGGAELSVGRFIAHYFPVGPERDLLAGGDFKIEKTVYDWALNIQPAVKRAPPPHDERSRPTASLSSDDHTMVL
jgi:hypothetical protein